MVGVKHLRVLVEAARLTALELYVATIALRSPWRAEFAWHVPLPVPGGLPVVRWQHVSEAASKALRFVLALAATEDVAALGLAQSLPRAEEASAATRTCVVGLVTLLTLLLDMFVAALAAAELAATSRDLGGPGLELGVTVQTLAPHLR